MTIDNQFIQHYEPMLRKLARQYASHLKQCPAIDKDDLVQEAWLRLMELSSQRLAQAPLGEIDHYAFPIRYSRSEVASGDSIELPTSIVEEHPQAPVKGDLELSSQRPEIPKTTRKRSQAHCQTPLCSFSDEDVLKTASNAMQAAIRRYANINVPLQEQHAIELPDNLPEGNPTEQWRAIQRAAEALSPHEKQLMDMLLKRIPRQEMATRMNIPHATLRQQIKRLRHKLRKTCPTIIR